jgi:DNA-directed RNA polymerase specialized sigma24 family protein
VLVLIDVSGLSYAQAAEALEQTPEAVSKQLARARKLLLTNIALEEKSKNGIRLAYSRFL